jgi:N-acetylglucosaminyldiphosphoundecaprenol N-acetyl-beta-D-mannosaminyltransferase
MKRVRFGSIFADSLRQNDALDAIAALVRRGEGGFVLTPNVDHVVLAESDERLRAAYAAASLSLVDGTPLVWLSFLLGHRLPERVAGSDLLDPLVARAAGEGWGVYLLGGAPGVAEQAARVWQARHPTLNIVGTDAPEVGFERSAAALQTVVERLRRARPALVLVALGCPKQEIWLHTHAAMIRPAVGLGIGAGFDFVAGKVRRAPRWISHLGLEWLFRLAQEPRRLYHRYLVRDRAIVGIAWRTWRRPRHERIVDLELTSFPSGPRTVG